jgi:hypothetical protein
LAQLYNLPDHNESPNRETERKPDADGVDHDAKVDVEPDKGRPAPGQPFHRRPARPQIHVHAERDVLDHHQHVRHGNAYKEEKKEQHIELTVKSARFWTKLCLVTWSTQKAAKS